NEKRRWPSRFLTLPTHFSVSSAAAVSATKLIWLAAAWLGTLPPALLPGAIQPQGARHRRHQGEPGEVPPGRGGEERDRGGQGYYGASKFPLPPGQQPHQHQEVEPHQEEDPRRWQVLRVGEPRQVFQEERSPQQYQRRRPDAGDPASHDNQPPDHH